MAGVREAELGVSGQLVVSLPVEAKQLRIDVALEGGHEVLRGDAMSGLVEEDRDEAVRAGAEEGVHHHDLRHRVVRAARVAAVAARRAHRGEEDDGVAAQLDVVGEVGLLGLGQRGVGERVDLDLAVRREVEREGEGVAGILQEQGAGSESRMRCGAHAAVFFRYGARPVPATIWHKGRQKGGPDGETGEAHPEWQSHGAHLRHKTLRSHLGKAERTTEAYLRHSGDVLGATLLGGRPISSARALLRHRGLSWECVKRYSKSAGASASWEVPAEKKRS
eukprot:COSAG04_NODE_28_length_36566_cov_70.886665_11_plen_278_part_00